MKAKIRDIGFSPDTIILGMDCYFEEGEAGYGNCFVDVPDYPIEEGQPSAPTHQEFVPFRSVSISLPVDVQEKDAVKAVKDKLEAFKRAHNKVVNAQQLVGQEFTV